MTLAARILVWMVTLQPIAPWRASYEATAAAIAGVVEREPPLFERDDSRTRTAALLTAVAWTEGRFDPHAIGDHGAARGAWQVHATPYSPEAASPGYLDDVELQARVALRMLRTSLTACKARDVDDRLAWYASGRCDRGGGASRYRMHLAKRLVVERSPLVLKRCERWRMVPPDRRVPLVARTLDLHEAVVVSTRPPAGLVRERFALDRRARVK